MHRQFFEICSISLISTVKITYDIYMSRLEDINFFCDVRDCEVTSSFTQLIWKFYLMQCKTGMNGEQESRVFEQARPNNTTKIKWIDG